MYGSCRKRQREYGIDLLLIYFFYKKKSAFFLQFFILPRGGLEPPRPYRHQILSLACLPIPSSGHIMIFAFYKNITQDYITKISLKSIDFWKSFVITQYDECVIFIVFIRYIYEDGFE